MARLNLFQDVDPADVHSAIPIDALTAQEHGRIHSWFVANYDNFGVRRPPGYSQGKNAT